MKKVLFSVYVIEKNCDLNYLIFFLNKFNIHRLYFMSFEYEWENTKTLSVYVIKKKIVI